MRLERKASTCPPPSPPSSDIFFGEERPSLIIVSPGGAYQLVVPRVAAPRFFFSPETFDEASPDHLTVVSRPGGIVPHQGPTL
jgi:hypothetical protein